MSDIAIRFEWYAYPILLLLIAWPGLLIGAVAGGLIWRRHRISGALLAGIFGCLLWAAGWYLWE